MTRRWLTLLSVASFGSSAMSLLNGDFVYSDLPVKVHFDHIIVNGIEAVGVVALQLLAGSTLEQLARCVLALHNALFGLGWQYGLLPDRDVALGYDDHLAAQPSAAAATECVGADIAANPDLRDLAFDRRKLSTINSEGMNYEQGWREPTQCADCRRLWSCGGANRGNPVSTEP